MIAPEPGQTAPGHLVRENKKFDPLFLDHPVDIFHRIALCDEPVIRVDLLSYHLVADGIHLVPCGLGHLILEKIGIDVGNIEAGGLLMSVTE